MLIQPKESEDTIVVRLMRRLDRFLSEKETEHKRSVQAGAVFEQQFPYSERTLTGNDGTALTPVPTSPTSAPTPPPAPAPVVVSTPPSAKPPAISLSPPAPVPRRPPPVPSALPVQQRGAPQKSGFAFSDPPSSVKGKSTPMSSQSSGETEFEDLAPPLILGMKPSFVLAIMILIGIYGFLRWKGWIPPVEF